MDYSKLKKRQAFFELGCEEVTYFRFSGIESASLDSGPTFWYRIGQATSCPWGRAGEKAEEESVVSNEKKGLSNELAYCLNFDNLLAPALQTAYHSMDGPGNERNQSI